MVKTILECSVIIHFCILTGIGLYNQDWNFGVGINFALILLYIIFIYTTYKIRRVMKDNQIRDIVNKLYWKAFKDGRRNDGFCDEARDTQKAEQALSDYISKEYIHKDKIPAMLKGLAFKLAHTPKINNATKGGR